MTSRKKIGMAVKPIRRAIDRKARKKVKIRTRNHRGKGKREQTQKIKNMKILKRKSQGAYR